MVNQTNLTHFLSVPYQSIKTVAPTELPPLMDEQVKRLCFENNERLVELVKQYGSPLNVIFPHTMQQNILKLNAVFQEHGVTGRIMYGVKVNQSNILVKIAVEEGIGVDV